MMSLLSASPEVLRTIVLHALDDRPCGPPHEWYGLVLSCRTLQRQLDTPAIHALLFTAAFHVPTSARPTLSAHAKAELTRRFTVLKFLKRGASCLEEAGLTDALWVAYVMLKAEAEPHQMNVDQLVWAGVPDLLLEFLKRRLHDGAQTNHGWPLCNQVNSLVIALMWLLSSESAIKAESPATRDEVMERIRPYVLAAFRYPLSAHEWYFSGDSKPATSNCTRGFKDVEYFGSKRTMGIPSAPIYAILCYFTRLDTLVPMFPLHLQRSSRALSTRSKSKVGPKREDVEHFINECRTRFESWTPSPCSSLRQVSPAVQPYLCGSLTGRWKGSSIVPYVNEYRQWQTDLKKPESMDTFCRQPLYITLREHFYCSLEVEPPRSNPKDPHSWLPASWEEHDDGIAIIDDSTNCKRFYQTRVDGEERPENIADVLITGQTDDPYAAAWGAFKVFGRVRLSDGLVFLRRESIAGLGTTLLRGYLSSSNNFAGRYRALNVEAEVAEWEAPFSLCKMEES